ncbi:MAG TPA: hypothetical protein VF598_10325, partial [Hymenobacter sp.]
MKLLAFSLASLLLLSVGCKKEKTELDLLPAATQQGKNTFGFLLNNKAWLPRRGPLGTSTSINAYSIRTNRDGRILHVAFSRANEENN